MLARIVGKAASLLIAALILFLGLWLAYQQIFVASGLSGLVTMMAAFLIVAGVAWITADVVALFLPVGKASAFLKRVDVALTRGRSMLDAAFSAMWRALGKLLRLTIFLAGLGLMLAAFACWGLQGYSWLKDGMWPPVPVGAFIDFNSTGWIGFDEILLWLLDFNIGVPLLICGFWIMALSTMDTDS